MAKTKATTCSGPPKPNRLRLGKAPSPVCAGAQDIEADTATLRILTWVQTRSSAHRGCRQKPVPDQTRGRGIWPTRAERARRTTVAGTGCYARTHGHPRLGPALVAHLVGSSLSNMLEGKELALSGGLALPPAASGEPRALCTQTSDPILCLRIPKAWVRSQLPASR